VLVWICELTTAVTVGAWASKTPALAQINRNKFFILESSTAPDSRALGYNEAL
jgi:hypothetical protein